MEGIIMKALSGFYYVDDGQTVTACRGRGKLRHQKVTPLVGDRVEFTPLGDGSGSLDRILPRKNQFYRPAVANIDQLVIIASQAIPVTDPFLIDRVAAIAQSRDCPCVICVNKCDLEPGDDLAAIYTAAGFPTLKVSSYYHQLMRSTDEAQVRDYLTGKLRQARWVVRSVEQRRSTLLSCANCIVDRQEAFFRHGPGHLRPMTLADVAAVLDVHESTVSRAVKDKYLQCAHGVFPLGYFFTRALPSGGSEGVSTERAKAQLKAILEGEDRKKPLSDQKLCELLKGRGVNISRRTVAKYRDELGFPSAVGRKEF